jgi:uncharacterized membrane protein
MHTTILVAFLAFSRTVVSMCSAGVLLFLLAAWAAKNDIARARGLDKIVALSNLCFATPLAVFGALHLAAAQGLSTMVPSYMPWHLFWAYFFGFALIAASLSIATKIQVRWSGLLFGIAMFLFVAMMDIPGSLATPKDRIAWTLTLREMLFGGGGWILAGNAMRGRTGSKLITVGRLTIGIAAIFYGIENSLHTANVPGVPLEKLMPAWIPAHLLIGWLTGAILVVSGVCILLNKKTRMAATYLGTWIVLLVVFIYGPILISALADPSTDVKVEGINYFFDTLLFAGAILALANATPRTDQNRLPSGNPETTDRHNPARRRHQQMSKATEILQAAQKRAMAGRPKVGGFPYLAETTEKRPELGEVFQVGFEGEKALIGVLGGLRIESYWAASSCCWRSVPEIGGLIGNEGR